MPIDNITRVAMENGRQQAARVLEVREISLEKRAKALKAHARKSAREAGKPGVAPRSLVAPPPKGMLETAGMLVAEGDSWFDYPWHDVLKLLEDDHGYDVESVARKGDPIEEMAYGENQLGDLTRCIEKVLRRGVTPKAVLLSGGGNDIAGEEFGMLLNHSRSVIAGFNQQVVDGVIDQRIRTAFVTILGAVTEICLKKTGSAIPILVHGYDYPVPDGRGFMGGMGSLPGPWLEPGFRGKGYEDLEQRIELTRTLMDRFNSMVEGVANLQPFAHVKYINLRNTLSHGKDYKRWWANELHPTGDGFGRVTDKFAAVLGGL